jgi:ribonuclease Y
MMTLIAAIVLAAGLVGAAALLSRRAPATAGGPAAVQSGSTVRPAERPAGDLRATAAVAAPVVASDDGERRDDVVRLEERLLHREEGLVAKLEEVAERERRVQARALEVEAVREQHVRELERVAGLSASQAKAILLKQVDDQVRHDSARLVRQIEEETKRDADRRVRNILAVVMQRMAAGHAAETTVSVVQLTADDMKGRIIGREGRNIRALEHLTGVDFIIDDTPNAVILSGFDGVRREIARLTLEKLLSDGRIHPARIEETYYQAKSELESHIAEVGEQAGLDANVQALAPELTAVLGRLKYRTSYGQNVSPTPSSAPTSPR